MGSVVLTQCDQHLRFSYQFVVNGMIYRGLAISDRCRQIKSGDTISIRYLPEDPAINIGADPKRVLVNNAVTILIASLTIPLVLLLILRIKLRRLEKII